MCHNQYACTDKQLPGGIPYITIKTLECPSCRTYSFKKIFITMGKAFDGPAFGALSWFSGIITTDDMI